MLRRFTQKLYIIVEDIDDHGLFPSSKTVLIVNGENEEMEQVCNIFTLSVEEKKLSRNTVPPDF